MSDASGVAITCDIVPVDDCLSPANGLRLFRVLQEGLNNVLKHAGATEVTINGTRVGDTIVMRLSDNGRGFDPAAARPTNAGHGFGLIGMTERVRMMGGSMAIESAPGAGTTITIELRCDAKASGVSA